jgi:hypothetical protein
VVIFVETFWCPNGGVAVGAPRGFNVDEWFGTYAGFINPAVSMEGRVTILLMISLPSQLPGSTLAL